MSTSQSIIRGDIDTPRPIRASNGHLKLEGWCLLSGTEQPPSVRLISDAFTLPMTERVNRSDLTVQMPEESAARHSGFIFDAILPHGIHLARLECETTEGSWQVFKTLCLAVEPRPFAASLDTSESSLVFDQRIHLEGWALHPLKEVQSLGLRYGHREILCQLGRSRNDLPLLYPSAPHAKNTGFKSATILDAGYGALRLKASFADGSTAVARTPHRIAIATDENIGAEIDLQAERIGLPIPTPTTKRSKPGKTAHPLNVLFVLHGSFASNSALHLTALANELADTGHACVVAVTHDLSTLAQHRNIRFTGMLHADVERELRYPNQTGPDIIHAWTTRENVRILTEKIRLQHPAAKVLIHLEDNEQHILAEQLGLTVEQLDQTSEAELESRITSDLSHPKRSRKFLASCDGITIINESLRKFVPPNCPHRLLWPAADASCFHPQPLPEKFRRILDREEDETVLFYHGNVHASNASEVRELYLAVDQLNREGDRTTLIRTGLDKVDFLGDLASRIAPHVLALGQIPHHHHLPALMSLADFFVQPGTADTFNDYRFPSKLPEFFALGRPVILPRTNLGNIVRHRQDAYVLANANADGISQAVRELRGDSDLREQLSQGALTFSREHFSWSRSAAELATFYQHLTR